MIWLILIVFLVFGIALVIKSKSASYKILGHAILAVSLIFILFFISNIGIGSEEDIIENPEIQLEK